MVRDGAQRAGLTRQGRKPRSPRQGRKPGSLCPGALARGASPGALAKGASPGALAKGASPGALAKGASPAACAREPSPGAQAREPSPGARAQRAALWGLPAGISRQKDPKGGSRDKKRPRGQGRGPGGCGCPCPQMGNIRTTTQHPQNNGKGAAGRMPGGPFFWAKEKKIARSAFQKAPKEGFKREAFAGAAPASVPLPAGQRGRGANIRRLRQAAPASAPSARPLRRPVPAAPGRRRTRASARSVPARRSGPGPPAGSAPAWGWASPCPA